MNTANYVSEIVDGLAMVNRREGFAQLLLCCFVNSRKGRRYRGRPCPPRSAGRRARECDARRDARYRVRRSGPYSRLRHHASRDTAHVRGRWPPAVRVVRAGRPDVPGDDRRARVASSCPATGRPVSLVVTPSASRESSRRVRSSHCGVRTPRPAFARRSAAVHFFASRPAGERWISQTGEAELLERRRSLSFGRAVGNQLLGHAGVESS